MTSFIMKVIKKQEIRKCLYNCIFYRHFYNGTKLQEAEKEYTGLGYKILSIKTYHN